MIGFYSHEQSIASRRPGLIDGSPETDLDDDVDRPSIESQSTRILGGPEIIKGKPPTMVPATIAAPALVKHLESDEPPLHVPAFLQDLSRLREILNGLDLSPIK